MLLRDYLRRLPDDSVDRAETERTYKYIQKKSFLCVLIHIYDFL